jgi:hypothetical protein
MKIHNNIIKNKFKTATNQGSITNNAIRQAETDCQQTQLLYSDFRIARCGVTLEPHRRSKGQNQNVSREIIKNGTKLQKVRVFALKPLK